MTFYPIKILTLIMFLKLAVFSQTPTPTVTGKSYSNAENTRPTTTAPQYPSPVKFTDITQKSGVNFRHQASPTSIKYLLETTGAGVAIFDFDNDGLMDLFFTNGAEIKNPMPKDSLPDKTDQKFWDRFYRQNSDGTFTDVTEKAGVKGIGYSYGVAVGDYNKDGFQDLFVTRFGGATLLQNNGNGTFADVTKKLNINIEGWATSTGFFDYNQDGRLDIFVTRYAIWDFEKGDIYCGELRPGYRAYCHPDNFKPIANILLQQQPDGSFANVSEKSLIDKSKGKALGVGFADFDDDGWTDVFVANDNMNQQLFHNQKDGTFIELALPAGVAFNENGGRFAGMGIDIADYDGDAKQDVIITALSNETYPLYRNNGDLFFDYTTQISGVGQITVLGTGWGVKFLDADNDGRRDIFVAQSHVLDTIEKTSSFIKYKQPALLMRNTEKGFQNISFDSGEVFTQDFAARGLACGDLNNDGNIDVVIAQTDGTPVILRNKGTKNNWLGLDLRGTKSAPNGEGARVTVIDSENRKQVFDVSNSGSYISANDSRLIIGLGTAKSVVSVDIRWNGGQIKKLNNLEINRYHLIREN